ncbi:erythromycin esterase family protein [Granulicella sp. S156]|uniref:erythromycin esterase family protein n=1 Tax=Granulicella sp. S156 TaxID=1747224 RepID=UPI00131CC016|nr:erythromycin esterase family protein [Granulicella sp. S156]
MSISSRNITLSFRVYVLALLIAGGSSSLLQAQRAEPLDLNAPTDEQYAFLSPLLKDVEVVSLAESIHITHEFPLARLGIVRWINQNSGYRVLAFEGSPEDMWISQDDFIKHPDNASDSTSGLFPLWNTEEMSSIFAYERSTWSSSHPLYITAYDIQPGTSRGTQGPSVFGLLQEHLVQYAPPPSGFNAAAWEAALTPLIGACGNYESSEEEKAEQAIELLEQWIAIAAPRVEAAYPNLPMHAAALRLIPQNLRQSLALCQTVGGAEVSQRNWRTYKQTRDRLAAQYALSLKMASPNRKLILWAHLSHLFYDSEGKNTSVGEILHQTLGPRLYTIGTFALGGGTIVLFSNPNDDYGYTRVFGISRGIKAFTTRHCPEVCFTDLRHLPPDSPMAGPQRLWFEATPMTLPLADDVDGAIWVKNVHTPHLRVSPLLFLIMVGKHYVPAAVSLMVLFLVLLLWLAYRRRQRKQPRIDRS